MTFPPVWVASSTRRHKGLLLHSPFSGQVPSSWWLLESEVRGSLAGGERAVSAHLAASVWKLPTGVVPPDDSPPRDLSSSLWASSMSCKSHRENVYLVFCSKILTKGVMPFEPCWCGAVVSGWLSGLGHLPP